MADETRIYISIGYADRGRRGQLVVDGPMDLWRELLATLRAEPAAREPGARGQSGARGRARWDGGYVTE